MKAAHVFGLWLAIAALIGGCGGSDQPAQTPESDEIAGKLTVFAASSLTDAFKEMGSAFQAAHPDVAVSFNFAGSPTLRTQIEQGARADVYASANATQMEAALKSGAAIEPAITFARNSLVIITPARNDADIESPSDLAKPGLKLVLAEPAVPVGNYARQSLSAMAKEEAFGAGFIEAVLNNLVSNESNVRQVVAKVQLGEADAGIVYGTDVTPSVASNLKAIDIPSQFNVIAEYPIARVSDAANPDAAQSFIDFVLSTEGQAILKKYGFQDGA